MHINAELSELIDANRQMESSRWSASALVPPRLPGRTAAHFASHRLCTSRGGRHRHSAASDDSTSLHLLGSAPYSLHGAGGFRRSRRSLPRGDGGFTSWHQAFASIDRPVAMGRGKS